MRPIFQNLVNEIEEFNKIKLDNEQKVIIKKINSFIPNNYYSKIVQNFLNKKNGVYLHGQSGVGKTMIMNSLVNILYREKCFKSHFNELILKLQKLNFSSEKILKSELIKNKIFFKNQVLICIDELSINNIADIIILEKFLKFSKKMKIFTFFTSNLAPENLYFNNHQKKKIDELINFIKTNLIILKLESENDYRKSFDKCLNFVFDKDMKTNLREMKILRYKLAGEISRKEKKFSRIGNSFILKNIYGKLLECEFNEICGKNFGFKDYKLISKEVHFFLIKNIPNFKKSISEKEKRFITLIDVIYEEKKILSISTKFNFKKLNSLRTQNLEVNRMLSRLNELFSKKYIEENLEKI